MKLISEKSIEACWKAQTELDAAQVDQEFQLFQQQQPNLFAFLHEISDEELVQESYDFLFYLALSVWRIMKAQQPDLSTIGLPIFQQTFIKYQSYFEAAEDDEEAEDAVLEIFEDFHQKDLLAFISEAVFDEEEFDDNDKGFIFIAMLMTIEGLDQ